jgi:hypothetical protein
MSALPKPQPDEALVVANDATRPADPPDPMFVRLMSLPVERPGRARLRDRVPLDDDKLASRAARFYTLATEYAKRRGFARDMAHPPHRPPPSLFTIVRRERHASDFAHLRADMPLQEYIEQFERNAGLVPLDRPVPRAVAARAPKAAAAPKKKREPKPAPVAKPAPVVKAKKPRARSPHYVVRVLRLAVGMLRDMGHESLSTQIAAIAAGRTS